MLSRIIAVPRSMVAAAAVSRRFAHERVSVVGSGHWGSAITRVASQNVLRHPGTFAPQVTMWVHQEVVPALTVADMRTAFRDQVGEGGASSRGAATPVEAKDARVIFSSPGALDRPKLQALLEKVGLRWTEAQVTHAVLEMDKNGDGLVDEYELSAWWQSYQQAYHTRPLAEIIDSKKENVKYLPGIALGDNMTATGDLEASVRDATVVVLVTPHQYLAEVLGKVKAGLNGRTGKDLKVISLIKGMSLGADGFKLCSQQIAEALGTPCSVMMGANLAKEVALEQFSEATIGAADEAHARVFKQLFDAPYFRTAVVQDVVGPEMCGTLKNVVGLAAGFADAVGLGNNAKAAIIRTGFVEMKDMTQMLYPDVPDATFHESCGLGDLVATCYGGRNRLVAEAWARAGGERSWEAVERDELKGQKIQGVTTSKQLQTLLEARGLVDRFPLFNRVNAIVNGQAKPESIVELAA